MRRRRIGTRAPRGSLGARAGLDLLGARVGLGLLGAPAVLGIAAAGLLLAAGCAPTPTYAQEDTTVNAQHQEPDQPQAGQAGSGQPVQRPTLDESAAALDAALAALEPVLLESIPAEAWEESIGGYRVGCSTGHSQGRYTSPLITSTGRYLANGSWPRIEQTLADHGYTSASAVPLEAGNAFIEFRNTAGGTITVSSIGASAGGDGGAGYGGETSCHEGFERPSDR